ncbi:MAG TPA: sugar ABC transporter substrate-binding protein [Naasia sp.]|jgi:multiple sugar transport system substrate-binding protein
MKSRRVIATSGSVAALVLLAGCAGGGGGGSAEPSTITLWSRGANETINQALADAWNEDHDVKVELLPVPDAEYSKKLAAAVAAGNPPDVATLDVVAIPEMMRGGILTDITDRATSLDFFDELAQSYVDHATVDGKIYALPENIDASTLFWNKDLFEQAGLDPEAPPANFDEIREYAAAITALGEDKYGFYISGQCAGCNAYTFSPLVWASGGDYVNEDGTEATLTSDGLVQALGLYQDLWESGDIPAEAKDDTGANWVSSFGSGNIGMIGLGAFAIAQMEENYPDVNFGITALPGADGGASSFTGGDVIAIPKGAKNEEAAWEFLEWSLGEDAQVEVYAKSGSLVARGDLIENEYATDPNVVAENEAALIGRIPTYYLNAGEIDAPTGPYNSAFQAIVFGGADIQSTLEQANEEFQRLLDQG